MKIHRFDTATLDALMPMHLIVGPTGHILHAGPTLRRLRPEDGLCGARLLEAFRFRRPGGVTQTAKLAQLSGRKLQLNFRDAPETAFKGHVVRLRDEGHLLLNLSFGIGVTEAVRNYGLTSRDFAPTDLAVEMLYLVEAKSAVMEELKQLNTRLQGAKRAAEEQAFADALTGLGNRRALDDVLERLVRQGAPFGLMQIDLDFFKDVNDTLGHAAGDGVLCHAAEALVEETRAGDVVTRSGGDEFVIVFPGLTETGALRDIAARIIARLEEPVLHDGHPCRVSASIGITVSDLYAEPGADRMLADADIALYTSKQRGRARATVYSHDQRQADWAG